MEPIREIDVVVTTIVDGETEELTAEFAHYEGFEMTEDEFISELTNSHFADITSGFKADIYYQFESECAVIYVDKDDADWVKEDIAVYLESK